MYLIINDSSVCNSFTVLYMHVMVLVNLPSYLSLSLSLLVPKLSSWFHVFVCICMYVSYGTHFI